MELGGQGSYRQLAEEIGTVLQSAAETAEKMQEDARAEAAHIRSQAEAELRLACAEGRRILDDARMEADMVRAEAEWQAQEIVAQARQQAAERLAGADTRLAEAGRAEGRVLERLAGVGQMVAAAIASLREGSAAAARDAANAEAESAEAMQAAGVAAGVATAASGADDDADEPTAKVYFVEFPPAAPPATAPAQPAAASPGAAEPGQDADSEIVLTDNPGASLVVSDKGRSEWAPPVGLPTWWTRDGAQG